MRVLALFARHPWLRRLRTVLVLLVAASMLWDGARLWVSAPDAVHITITQVYDDRTGPAIKTVTFDRTIHGGAVAQRLQRDLAALTLADPFAEYSCPLAPYAYNMYTLTWYRAGLPVERAIENRVGACTWLVEDGVLFRSQVNVDTFSADIDAAAAGG